MENHGKIQEYLGLLMLLFFIFIVMARNINLKSQGIDSVEFGGKDRKDFILIPFAIFYFYLIIANAFSLPTIKNQHLFYLENISWAGVLLCFIALVFFIWTLISFKNSFAVGLVDNRSQGLITTGAFAVSRNPIYLAFAVLLVGQFLIFPSWILMLYVFVAPIIFHRQVLKEETFLRDLYGAEFDTYCKLVRRYL